MLPDVISCEIKWNVLSTRVFEWHVILVGCKIYSTKESEARKPKKSLVGWCS